MAVNFRKKMLATIANQRLKAVETVALRSRKLEMTF
tara:strand:+ start:702 stop:809 length:108 start_codon:yes stop_codon:yes gene_type:complete